MNGMLRAAVVVGDLQFVQPSEAQGVNIQMSLPVAGCSLLGITAMSRSSSGVM